jgi:hypothetical protein
MPSFKNSFEVFEIEPQFLCFILHICWYIPSMLQYLWEMLMFQPVIFKFEGFCFGDVCADLN